MKFNCAGRNILIEFGTGSKQKRRAFIMEGVCKLGYSSREIYKGICPLCLRTATSYLVVQKQRTWEYHADFLLKELNMNV
jgi:hypothetical protein